MLQHAHLKALALNKEGIYPLLSPEWKEYYDSDFDSYKAVEIFI